MNRLEEIIASKKNEVARASSREKEYRLRAERRLDFRDFAGAIFRGAGPVKLIAEVKRASPSAGIIAPSYDPAGIARQYQREGAAAVSVLTEKNYFLGSVADLGRARNATKLPVLRKDFIVDQIQVLESAANDSDAVLLIAAALRPAELSSLHQCAISNRLSVVVEVHTREEINLAVDAGARIIGINNRDLATLEVDLGTTEKLLPYIPAGIIIVSESGIRHAEDVSKMSALSIDALLVGETLMRRGRGGLLEITGQLKART